MQQYIIMDSKKLVKTANNVRTTFTERPSNVIFLTLNRFLPTGKGLRNSFTIQARTYYCSTQIFWLIFKTALDFTQDTVHRQLPFFSRSVQLFSDNFHKCQHFGYISISPEHSCCSPLFKQIQQVSTPQ